MRMAGAISHHPLSARFMPMLAGAATAQELHMNIMAADNDLVGNGTTPVDLLAVSRSAIFTHPDETKNKYVRVGLSGTYAINENTSRASQCLLQQSVSAHAER